MGHGAENIYYLALSKNSWPTLGLTMYDLEKGLSCDPVSLPPSWERGCLCPTDKEPVLDDFTSGGKRSQVCSHLQKRSKDLEREEISSR